MKLQILICSIEKRYDYLQRLLGILHPQLVEGVSIQVAMDKGEMKIGEKRNQLLQQSPADYVCFVDDDDMVSSNYIYHLMQGIEKEVDCCSLKGIITENGNNPQVFEHSIKYDAYKTNPQGYAIRYERFPNHLNCMKSSIAKMFTFPEKNHGEDTDWATKVHRSGLLEKEHYIEPVIYFYEYISNK